MEGKRVFFHCLIQMHRHTHWAFRSKPKYTHGGRRGEMINIISFLKLDLRGG